MGAESAYNRTSKKGTLMTIAVAKTSAEFEKLPSTAAFLITHKRQPALGVNMA